MKLWSKEQEGTCRPEGMLLRQKQDIATYSTEQEKGWDQALWNKLLK